MKYCSSRISLFLTRKYVVYFSIAITMLAIFMVCQSNTKAAPVALPPLNVKFTARALYNGNFKYGNWLPIEVTLQNDGTANTVQVETTIVSQYSNIKLTSNYSRSVSLAPRTSKKIILYAHPFAQTGNSIQSIGFPLEVRLTSQGDIVDRQQVQVQPVDNGDYLVGMLGVKQAVANLLDNTKVGPIHSHVTTAVFTPQELPDRVEGLSSFDALVISNASTDTLSKEQQSALKSWVSNGGTLLLMGGEGWSKVTSGLDTSLLPFQVYDYANTDDFNAVTEMLGDKSAEALPLPTVIARGQILQGATALAIGATTVNGRSETSPLVAQKTVGDGRVIGVAADLTVPPLTEWSETPRLWQSLLNYSAPVVHSYNSDNSNQYNSSNAYFGLVSSLPSLELPNLWPFFVLVAVYILVVGPLNYLVLKSLRRMVWGWLSIPASIALFTAIVLFLYVNSQPGGQVLVNQLSVIKADSEGQYAQLQSYVAVFSPQDKNYQVKMSLPPNATYGLYNPLLHQSGYALPEPPHTITEDGNEATLENFHVGQWSVQGFNLQSSLNGHSYKLQTNLHFQDGAIVGSIQNNSGGEIQDSMLIYGSQLVRIPDMAAGQLIQVKLPLEAVFDTTLSYCSAGYSTYNSYAVNPVSDKLTALWQDRTDDKDLQNRMELEKRLFQDGEIGPLNPRQGLALVGWLGDSPIGVNLSGVSTQVKSHQLLVDSLPLSFETKSGDGRLNIPASFLRPDSATDEHGSATPTNRVDRPNQACLSGGTSLIVQYHLPTQDGAFNVQHLQLYLSSFVSTNGHLPTMPTSSALYDWQHQQWVVINNWVNNARPYVSPYNTNSSTSTPPPSMTVVPTEISDPARFANPQTGLILWRFDQTDTQTLQVQFNLAAQGTH